MNFAFTEEQEQLRQFVRQFMEEKSSEAAVREMMETDSGYDPKVWSQMAEQMGLPSLIIPEEFGGQGYTFVELGVVLEEMGRALLCAPFFSGVLASLAILESGDDAAKAEYLPGIASGETIATLAYTEENGKWDDSAVTATADASGKITGTKSFVIDGATASLLVVAAKSDAGISLYAVDSSDPGVTATALSTMDQTRKQAKIELNGAQGKLIGTDGGGWDTLVKTLDLAAIALAAEQVGGAQFVLEMAVQYAKDRVQFGRPIGSFQAIKHKCADSSSRSSRRSRLPTTACGAPPSATTNCRRLPRWPRPTARRRTSTLRPRTSRSTVASASPGSTRRTSTSSGPRCSSSCSVIRPITGSSWPSASGSDPGSASPIRVSASFPAHFGGRGTPCFGADSVDPRVGIPSN
ncbi:MAG: acyl-CoA dehydrogenase family protein [Acidimicrobiales bacterium]